VGANIQPPFEVLCSLPVLDTLSCRDNNPSVCTMAQVQLSNHNRSVVETVD
jgi:hypothetical protein